MIAQDGRVKTVPRQVETRNNSFRTSIERILKPNAFKRDKFRVVLFKDGKRFYRHVDELVQENFEVPTI